MPVKSDRGKRSLGSKSAKDLIEAGRQIAKTQRALANALGCSERMLSMAFSQGHALSEEARRRLLLFVHHGGNVSFADAPILAGRQPRAVPTGGAMHFRLTKAEYDDFERLATDGFMGALSDAVTSYVTAHDEAGLPAPPALPDEDLVDARIRIDVSALVALNDALRAAGDSTLRLRNLHLRAALLEWVAKRSSPKEKAHGRKVEEGSTERGRRTR